MFNMKQLKEKMNIIIRHFEAYKDYNVINLDILSMPFNQNSGGVEMLITCKNKDKRLMVKGLMNIGIYGDCTDITLEFPDFTIFLKLPYYDGQTYSISIPDDLIRRIDNVSFCTNIYNGVPSLDDLFDDYGIFINDLNLLNDKFNYLERGVTNPIIIPLS